jgi:hypothetical protein
MIYITREKTMMAKAINLDNTKYRNLIKDCELEVLHTVPASHNRIVAEKKYALAKSKILAMEGGDCEIEVNTWIFYTAQYNLGTKKYPHMIEIIECDKVVKVCDKTVQTSAGTRPNAARILAVSKDKVRLI